jgi:hypothetical protein
MSKATTAPMSLRSVLANFEKTIDENERVGVNSGMYLTTNVTKSKASSKAIRKNQQRYERTLEKGKKPKANLTIPATLDETSDFLDTVINFDPFDESLMHTSFSQSAADIDEMSIISFHSGSRRSSVVSRTTSLHSDEDDTKSGRGSVISRSSARIRELPRDVLIESNDNSDSDSDSSSSTDSDMGDDEVFLQYPVRKVRHW